MLLSIGDVIPMDEELAADYWQLAADQRHLVAQKDDAKCLAIGRGVPVDEALSARYLKLSADQGNPIS
jgi:TPR repeat protein